MEYPNGIRYNQTMNENEKKKKKNQKDRQMKYIIIKVSENKKM